MNVEEGFRRITKVVTILILIISGGAAVVVFVGGLVDPSFAEPVGPFYALLIAVGCGVVAYLGTWGVFYLFRWIVRGFVGESGSTYPATERKKSVSSESKSLEGEVPSHDNEPVGMKKLDI